MNLAGFFLTFLHNLYAYEKRGLKIDYRCLRYSIYQWDQKDLLTPEYKEKYKVYICSVLKGLFQNCEKVNFMLTQEQGIVCKRYRKRMSDFAFQTALMNYVDQGFTWDIN